MKQIQEFLERPGGPIWRIFWLHVQHPRQFPIYDQHVHRAMAHLRSMADTEIDSNAGRKIEAYLNEYIPFARSFHGIELRKVDQALWSFGRYLKRHIARLDGITK